MSLFQPSVLKKYLSQQDTVQVQKAYKKYTKYFHNPVIQENIRNSKEEQFQEGFLRELFVDILGYTLNPAPSFNLTTELKNIRGAKKVDGAILKDGNALGVIELKGTNTKDLESIRQQAFDYKANQTGCIYVITSNFEKLRFYINNAVDYEEFNLFTLTHAEFEIFHLCLAKENILANKPLSIKEASIVEEENITKKFYGDYSVFKRELYRDLVKQNRSNILLNDLPEKTTKLILFQKSQKLIDRFLFILFAEDRGLLAPNSINTVLKEWKALADLDVEVPLYDRYKQYFGYLDTGRKGTEKKEEIFAYNGGLFQPDAILDAVMIDNEMLYRHTLKLSTYDFESQVDVNILGHIFEHSLNEIESVNAEIEGADFDKQKTKRKKDGVFYTPKYITKYIVDNTIGKLCTEKKQELGIIDEEYAKGRKNRQAITIIKLDQQLKDYREWLLQLTICDPACGSGAFLNQALDFLIREHAYLDELNKQLFGGFFVFPDIENQILEHNIYGVDLNEESIEIAKLSLWLRTAQPKRKLTSLNNNIKCGNSLIESKAVAGDKAFNWKEQFPEVFAKGGFDVIIGNPPYGIFIDPIEEAHYKKHFPLTKYKINLYILFIERMHQIFDKGIVHFIIPKSLLFNTYFENIRELLLVKSKLHEIFMLSEKVFPDAEVGGSLILKYEINPKDNSKEKIKLISADSYFDYEGNKCLINDIEQEFFLKVPHFEISPISKDGNEILKKITKLKPIKTYYKLKNGLNPGNIKHILISNTKETENHKPIIWGKEFSNYLINWGGQYVNYDSNIGNSLSIKDVKSKEGMNKQSKIDYALRTPEIFETKKLIVRKTGDRFVVAKDESNLYFDTLVHGIYQNNEEFTLDYLLAILNSKPATYIYRILHDIKGKVFAKISLDKLAAFPIPKPTSEIRIQIELLAVNLTSNLSELYKIRNKFTNYFLGQYKLEKLTKKLENWHELPFANFIIELNKAIKTAGQTPLTKKDEFEWLDLFEENKTKAQTFKSLIETTEKAIDTMVYELYGLSEEEIKLVEGN
ncbi:Eco57I restriction-modification methylase domain-containing protein [Flavobacterium yafengii]|uniref:Eco57I restriction-modification methylase domain-containing protein n=1 Tax=Flavobacterium yafengii TaxID=3041253 RepID=UPI0024A7F76C|nr:N-6 DNA methylase [Flavobacterium yafengii]MDI6046196.1 N-6 DNA methylase [Flavobacterium yafengii]